MLTFVNYLLARLLDIRIYFFKVLLMCCKIGKIMLDSE